VFWNKGISEVSPICDYSSDIVDHSILDICKLHSR